jgi:uncharacterized Tic20 family protein
VTVAKASQDPPSPVDAYEEPPAPVPAGEAPQPLPPGVTQSTVAAPKTSGDLNVLAVIALIASCLGFTIPGVVMGHIALWQIKKSGESGRGLAVAALIVGYALTVIVLIFIVLYFILIFAAIGIAGSAVGDAGNFG